MIQLIIVHFSSVCRLSVLVLALPLPVGLGLSSVGGRCSAGCFVREGGCLQLIGPPGVGVGVGVGGVLPVTHLSQWRWDKSFIAADTLLEGMACGKAVPRSLGLCWAGVGPSMYPRQL